MLGVTILELIANALAINRIDPFWVDLLQGSLLLIAVILGQTRSGSWLQAAGCPEADRIERGGQCWTGRTTVPDNESLLGASPSATVTAGPTVATATPLLEMRGISKAFPGVQALERVDLTLHAGEILALVGENGAGKSTLIKVLTGLYQADRGEIILDGRNRRPSARRATPSPTGSPTCRRSATSCPSSAWARTSCSSRHPRAASA